MNTPPYPSSPAEPSSSTESESIANNVKSTVNEVKANVTDTIHTYEAKIRESPDKAMLVALATGYCLQVLPLRTLITVPIRLTAFLAKPAILALGAMKAYELYEEQTKK